MLTYPILTHNREQYSSTATMRLFAEKVGNHIGHVDKNNWTLERWLIPTKMAWPLSLEEDNAGNLWLQKCAPTRSLV